MKRVAVIGASGFVGQYVKAELEHRCLEVTCTRRPRSEAGKPGWIPLDIDDPPASLEQLGNPDVVIHLAWSHLDNYRSLAHFETELPRQYNFLSKLVELGVPRIVVAGTCLEYGQLFGPLREDMPLSPTTPYGFAKDMLRRQLEQLARQRTFELVWGRLFYVYGEGQRDSSLFSALKLAVSRGDRSFKMSSGEQLRDFLPIEAAARILVDLALSKQAVGVVNVCSGKPISVRSLVENWLSLLGAQMELQLGHYPIPDYESLAFWGDSHKLENFRSREKAE